MTRLSALTPSMRLKAEAFVAKLNALGIPHVVLETRRTLEVQRAYYAQGRQPLIEVNAIRKIAGLYLLSEAENERIVTKTLNSRHLDGEAIDIAPTDAKGRPWWNAPAELWLRIGEVGESCGLEWGGRWGQTSTRLGWDCPHFQDFTKPASV